MAHTYCIPPNLDKPIVPTIAFMYASVYVWMSLQGSVFILLPHLLLKESWNIYLQCHRLPVCSCSSVCLALLPLVPPDNTANSSAFQQVFSLAEWGQALINELRTISDENETSDACSDLRSNTFINRPK